LRSPLARSVKNPTEIVKAESKYRRKVAKSIRLEGFEADFAFLFGAGLANPDHAAPDGVEFVITRDDLDQLSGSQPGAAAETESLGRTVHNQAGDPLGVRAEVDDDTGSFSDSDAFGAAAFAPKEGWHGFFLDGEFPHYTDYAMSAMKRRHRVNT